METHKIELIARVAHEANRAYCEPMGDDTQVAWEDAPDWQKDSACQGVHAFLRDNTVTPEKMHQSWMAVKEADGWVHGDEKDPEKKTHPCMVPYRDLPVEQRIKGSIFLGIVKQMVTVLRGASIPVAVVKTETLTEEEVDAIMNGGPAPDEFDESD